MANQALVGAEGATGWQARCYLEAWPAHPVQVPAVALARQMVRGTAAELVAAAKPVAGGNSHPAGQAGAAGAATADG